MIGAKPLAALAAALLLSVGVNLLQLRSAGKAAAACDVRIAGLQAAAAAAALERDDDALAIARDTRADVLPVLAEQATTTQQAQTRVQIVTRTITVPAGCPVALPERVQDELGAAVARANR